MSASAILDTTLALRRRIEAAVGGAIYVGPPIRTLMDAMTVSLFLFQIEASRDLRNSARSPLPAMAGPFTAPVVAPAALPLDLRYIVSFMRTAGATPHSDPDELDRLGRVLAALQADATLTDAEVAGQTVRLTLEPASLDDLNRLWGIFPEESYQTSLVYLATPVWVESGPIRLGPPVLEREQRTGVSTAPSLGPLEAAA